MDEIRAFVAHSFAEDDAGLVDKFLKYFTDISKTFPAFTWEHAEGAEPKELAKKVLSIISNKNAFIGICTKNERAINPDCLSVPRFQTWLRKAKDTDFNWKTSDWIIQEVGLAVGLRLPLVLLVEEGVRQPGGLQGNVEYISFEREAPEKSFQKILQMISALSPKTPSGLTTSPDVKSSGGAAKEQPTTPVDTDWKVPKPDWRRAQYERAMFHFVLLEDAAGAASINVAYLATPDSALEDNRVNWEARNEYLRVMFGKDGDIGNLTAIAAKYPRNSKIQEYLAKSLAEYDDNAEAAKKYEAAALVVTDAEEAPRLMGLAAVQFARAGILERTGEIVGELKSSVEVGKSTELGLLGSLRELAQLTKADDALVVIMERIVELEPNDFDARFALAYKHSDLGNNDLALQHYLKIPYQKRDKWAWNNLGVALDRFSMLAKAVNAYRQSEALGETLAMSNLANKLFSVGFISEAQELCNKALEKKSYHKDVAHLLTKLTDLPDEEDKKRDEVLEKAKPKGEFYKSLGRATSRSEPKTLAERWQGPDCILDLKLNGTTMRMSGAYEREENPNALGAALGGGLGILRRLIRTRVEYSGTLRGHTIDGSVTRTQEGGLSPASTILGLGENKAKFLMLVGDDGTEIKIMENPYSVYPTYYSLKRLTESAP